MQLARLTYSDAKLLLAHGVTLYGVHANTVYQLTYTNGKNVALNLGTEESETIRLNDTRMYNDLGFLLKEELPRMTTAYTSMKKAMASYEALKTKYPERFL